MVALSRWTLPWSFLLASCSSFQFERQQVFLRYQPETDVLDAVLAYEGVSATGEDRSKVDAAVGELESIARGRRHFIVFDWMGEVDIDALLDRLREKPIDPDDEHAGSTRMLLDHSADITPAEARFLREGREGEEGRLCLVQHLRFTHASGVLRMIDLFLNEAILEEMGDGDEEGMTGDAGTDVLQFARAKRGGSWARFDGVALEVSVPMTPGEAALQLKEMVESAASSPEAGNLLGQFLDGLSEIQMSAEELRLRFEPAKDGWICFTFLDARPYRPEVAERLERLGLVAQGDLRSEIQRLKAKP